MINLCFFETFAARLNLFGMVAKISGTFTFSPILKCSLSDEHICTGNLNDFEIWSHCGQTVAAANQLELWPLKGQCHWKEKPNKYLPWVFFRSTNDCCKLIGTFETIWNPLAIFLRLILEVYMWSYVWIMFLDQYIHLLVTKETPFQFFWNFLETFINDALFVNGCWHSKMFQAISHNFLMDEPWSKKGPTNLQIGWTFSRANCFESFERETTYFWHG